MADYILEIGTEEIPAKFMEPALSQMKQLAQAALDQEKITVETVEALGTPRRLALILKGLAPQGKDSQELVKGPARKAAYDTDNQPTKALQGFMKSQNVGLEDLEEKEVNGNLYVYARRQTRGRLTREALQSIIPGLIQSLSFPKPMRWGDLEFRFARPIRWLVSLYDQDILPLSIAAIEAGRQSRGHRTLSPDSFEIPSAQAYETTLEEHWVMVDPDKRKVQTWTQIQELAARESVVVEADEELLEEVTYLLEWPTPLMGSFHSSYLDIPEEVIITPMREHQRYFPVRSAEGRLLNHFVTVRNGGDYRLDLVQAGNEKVLAARLADARFFWDEDRKKTLEQWLPRLEKVVFQEKLGTISDKVKRIEGLTQYLAETLKVDAQIQADAHQVARLCKADLVTGMVCEFTELQGIMGRYYALEGGVRKEVAQGILEHYQPRFSGDVPPQSIPGAFVAIADKMDSIAGIFALRFEPTGSQDPYALRRAAMGICQTLLERHLQLDLKQLVEAALKQVSFVMEDNLLEDIQDRIMVFFEARMRNILTDQGHRYDVIDAAMGTPWQSLQEVEERAQALTQEREVPAFNQLQAVFTRAFNLAKKGERQAVVPALLQEPAEKALFEAIKEVQTKLDRDKGDLAQSIHLMSALAAPINRFFDEIMVMSEEEALRHNRLALLNQVVAMTQPVGDLSKLVD